jgi:hypothetical protein
VSTLDTISMLAKRASGEETDPANTDEELRLFALEMQKQALLGDLAAGFFTAPFDVGAAAGKKVHESGTAGAVGRGLRGLGNIAGEGVSRAAAIPFDHGAKLLSVGLPAGFLALDMASRAKALKQQGRVPDLAGQRLR